jgi:hypothetical protein
MKAYPIPFSAAYSCKSDNLDDQALKLKVRDAVLAEDAAFLRTAKRLKKCC